jgi:hypothetical protein
MNSDFKDLLRLLTEKEAKFLIIGGYAVIHYAEPRYTKDLDVLIGTDPDNAKKVFQALIEFGAPMDNVTSQDFCTPEVFFQIGLPPNRIDMIVTVPGVDFETAYTRRGTMSIGQMLVPVISRDDLIKAKLMAGRPQDLVDAGLLAKGGE